MTHGTGDRLADVARDAFVYGFPLVFNIEQIQRLATEGIGSTPRADLNSFGHTPRLAGPDDTFVTINNDTIYSMAGLDVSGGPVRLDVPDTDGRYYVLQFVDAWTNNFAYVGHRGTGTGAGSFLLVPPGWDGTPPDDARVIRLPSAVAVIVGRFAADGEDDLPAVRALQAGLRLTQTSPGLGIPAPDAAVPDDLAPFEKMRVWMQAFPPAPREGALLESFEQIGLLAAESPYVDPDPALADALRDGIAAGRELLRTTAQHGPSPVQNGWTLTYHAFDYNLDFFEVGALDDPAWKLADGPARLVERAVAALAGLWGNHGYEAAYAIAWLDGDGERLDGARRYQLRFASTPPVGAFWSVTMYDAEDFFLVANPIGRYSVGDRTPGLVAADDGSLTITVQHDEPGDPVARANWLPSPAGAFRPVLRMYEPDASVFDGGYELPPFVRVG
ncbi:MAG: DUF1254 domain-containing protein [Thermoleophilia bacterium]